jgi:hypothetical protein
MPISREEFERAELAESLTSRIENFLKQNNNTAYTRAEIFKNLFPDAKLEPDDIIMLSIALTELSKTNVVDARKIWHDGKEQVYYTALVR